MASQLAFGGILYAGLGCLICLLDRLRSKGGHVLAWSVVLSAAALALVGGHQDRRFEAFRQQQAALDTTVGAESEKAVLQP